LEVLDDDDKAEELTDETGNALRGEGDGAPLFVLGEEVNGDEAALVSEREFIGEANGLGAGSWVLEVNALIKLEILGLTPLTEEKADEEELEGDKVGVVTGDGERSLVFGGWRVLLLLLLPFSLTEEEEGGALVRRSRLVIDWIGEGGIRCMSLAGSVCELTVFF